jgi:hypothetical protein
VRIADVIRPAAIRFASAAITFLICATDASGAGAGQPAPLVSPGIVIAAPPAQPGVTLPEQINLSYRISVKPRGNSLHEIADAIGKTAAEKFTGAQLFEFEIDLGDYAGNVPAQLALRNFHAVARLAIPGQQVRYIDAGWLSGIFGFATIGPAEFACIRAQCVGGANEMERPELHPPLRDWKIDRSEIVRAVAEDGERFGSGLMMVTVTSAIRARTIGKAFGAGGARSAALFGLPGDHAVAVIVGAPNPCDAADTGESRTGYLCGNYLVIDGADGSDLDAGSYREFHVED